MDGWDGYTWTACLLDYLKKLEVLKKKWILKTFRHADGGFESVPMADAEENGHPSKWDNGVRILVTPLQIHLDWN